MPKIHSLTSQLRKSSLTSNSDSSWFVLGKFQPRPFAPSYSCCSILPPFFECPSAARESAAFSLLCEWALEELLGRRSKLGDRYFPGRLCRVAASALSIDSRWFPEEAPALALWASLFQQELPANSSSINLSAGRSQALEDHEAARVRRYISCMSAISRVLVLIDGSWPGSSSIGCSVE